MYIHAEVWNWISCEEGRAEDGRVIERGQGRSILNTEVLVGYG
jgi:hypothetical protein